MKVKVSKKNLNGELDISMWYITDHRLCEKCRWYNDCELGYACPPLELLQRNRE